MTVRLLLIRHGAVDFESTDFTESPRGRQWDPGLGERGLQQARRLAARLVLSDPPIVIAVSPFRRCRETIQPYLDASGGEVRVVDDLGEVFIGRWEGVRFEEILSENEDLARRFREQEPVFAMAPGGETGEQLRARVVPAVESVIAAAPEGTVVVVAHGGVINAYLGHVMGVAHDMFFLPDNASINTVVADGDRREMRFLNDVRHLTDPALFVPPAAEPATASGIGERRKPTDRYTSRAWMTEKTVERRIDVAVKFLSEEWAQAVQDALNSSDSFKSAAGSQSAKVQQVVNTDEGEKKYWFKLEGGQASLGIGDSPEPVDATITQDKATAEALAKNELTGTAAYMSGKLRVSGDLMKLMQLQGALGQMPGALKDVEVEY